MYATEVKVELSYAIGHDKPIQATAIINYDSGWARMLSILKIMIYPLMELLSIFN